MVRRGLLAAQDGPHDLRIHDGYGPENPLLADLGPHTTGVGCVYVKRLAALDLAVLESLVRNAWASAPPATDPHQL
ncbi:hypothetical protein ELQ92_00660 [Labedella populi]|uniref:DUF1801 domain-containing protein n=1 Tax=Labedella populi TaxID=2498850 RepID=A0A3S5CP12_9MICO|nr:hypothetical protein [Labedella populi]RWZ67820.1 hypothetical protein ELQ92_00660 [Labedella populi]